MNNFKRRDFIKTGIALTSGLYVNGLFARPLINKNPSPGDIPTLAVVKNGSPAVNVRKAVDLLGGISRFVKQGDNVLVKPNMAWDRTPEQAANTNPSVMAELVKMCYEAGAKEVLVLDHTCQTARRTYKRSGIEKACKDNGATVRFIHQSRFEKVDIPDGELLKSWTFYRDALEADVLINVPIAKQHSISGYTLGFKNCIPLLSFAYTFL